MKKYSLGLSQRVFGHKFIRVVLSIFDFVRLGQSGNITASSSKVYQIRQQLFLVHLCPVHIEGL